MRRCVVTDDIVTRPCCDVRPCGCADARMVIDHLHDEIERLRAENQRLKEARFDLQASDFHCWVCADFLSTARRRTDIHRLKEEEKAVRGE